MKSKTSNQKKLRYRPVSVTCIDVLRDERFMCGLNGSIVDATTTVTVRGQDVDEYDFSKSDFNHEWGVE